MKLGASMKLLLLGRCALGLTFVWAGLSKVPDLPGFEASIQDYGLPMPGLITRLITVVLPWLELVCGILLLAGIWTGPALVCAASLLWVFVAVTGQAWLRGLPIACGCFDLTLFRAGDPYSNLAKVFESVEFAFARALFLASFAVFLVALHRRVRIRRATGGVRGNGSDVPAGGCPPAGFRL